jgi:hypothetical protein
MYHKVKLRFIASVGHQENYRHVAQYDQQAKHEYFSKEDDHCFLQLKTFVSTVRCSNMSLQLELKVNELHRTEVPKFDHQEACYHVDGPPCHYRQAIYFEGMLFVALDPFNEQESENVDDRADILLVVGLMS